ncbi:MAG: hypothetical protein RIE31_11270 [Alphaproteobacteria bacterium]
MATDSSATIVLWATAGYSVIHLLAYIVFLRNWPSMRQERGIFAFHMISFLLVSVAAALVGLYAETVGPVIAAIAVHGIYSLSFLEAWSLAQGGYSLTILDRLSRTASQTSDDVLKGLEAVGLEKLQSRYRALVAMGLIAMHEDGKTRLTIVGRAVTLLLAALVNATATRKSVS